MGGGGGSTCFRPSFLVRPPSGGSTGEGWWWGRDARSRFGALLRHDPDRVCPHSLRGLHGTQHWSEHQRGQTHFFRGRNHHVMHIWQYDLSNNMYFFTIKIFAVIMEMALNARRLTAATADTNKAGSRTKSAERHSRPKLSAHWTNASFWPHFCRKFLNAWVQKIIYKLTKNAELFFISFYPFLFGFK